MGPTLAQAPAGLGLVVGGAFADAISWRAGFFINVPIAAVMVVMALRYLPGFQTVRGRFDLIGALTSTVGMGALVYGIIQAGERGWADPLTTTPMLLGLAVLAVFVLNEWRARQPIMPLRPFASRQRSGAAVARLLFAGTMIGFFFTTQFFQGVYGWTPLQAGLGFLPMTILQFGSSLLVSRLTRRFGGPGLVNTAHQLGSTLGVAVLTAVAAGAGSLEERVVEAYRSGTVMVAVAALAALILILPAARSTSSERSVP